MRKLVFSLQLTVAQCSTLRCKGMKCKNWTAHALIAMKQSLILLLILLLLRTALASYWQSLVHLNCACVYYNPLLLHKINKIKMAGTTRGVSWSLPVFSIKKTLNSQGNLKKILFKVLTIGFYTFGPSFRQIMDTIPKKPFLFQGKPFDEPFFDFFKLAKRCSASECSIDANRW